MRYRFPASDPTEPKPSDPKDEPTREYVNAYPEGLIERIKRTRRYFRLVRQQRQLPYARGLDSNPEDFA